MQARIYNYNMNIHEPWALTLALRCVSNKLKLKLMRWELLISMYDVRQMYKVGTNIFYKFLYISPLLMISNSSMFTNEHVKPSRLILNYFHFIFNLCSENTNCSFAFCCLTNSNVTLDLVCGNFINNVFTY